MGDIKVMDARRTAAGTAPDIIDQVRILAITTAIPNDTLSFGPEFPQELRDQIVQALIDLSADTEAWNQTALGEAYSWTGLDPIGDEAYDIVRNQIAFLGRSEEDILGG